MEKPSSSVDSITIFPQNPVFRFFSLISYYFVLGILKIFFPLLFSLRVEGASHLRDAPAAVAVSNHSLYLDPAFAACAAAPRRFFFSGMEKTFTESKKPFELLIRLLGGFPIPNSAPWQIIEPVSTLLAAKRNPLVLFYPEGFMTYKNRDLFPFKAGAFLVSQIHQIPIIPIVIISIPRTFWFSKIVITVLPPLSPLPSKISSSAKQKQMIRAQAEQTRCLMQKAINSIQEDYR